MTGIELYIFLLAGASIIGFAALFALWWLPRH